MKLCQNVRTSTQAYIANRFLKYKIYNCLLRTVHLIFVIPHAQLVHYVVIPTRNTKKVRKKKK